MGFTVGIRAHMIQPHREPAVLRQSAIFALAIVAPCDTEILTGLWVYALVGMLVGVGSPQTRLQIGPRHGAQ